MSYERAYMSTEIHEYFMEMLVHLNEYNDRHGQICFSKNNKEAALRVIEEEEEWIKRNMNNITCDTSFRCPIAMNLQKKNTNWSLERQLASGVLAEMVKFSKDVLSNQQSAILTR